MNPSVSTIHILCTLEGIVMDVLQIQVLDMLN